MQATIFPIIEDQGHLFFGGKIQRCCLFLKIRRERLGERERELPQELSISGGLGVESQSVTRRALELKTILNTTKSWSLYSRPSQLFIIGI
jgi:hypothetical protein